jgi:DHA1 family bicyclomycin/chloramphenicol resistance-like MFS transporter
LQETVVNAPFPSKTQPQDSGIHFGEFVGLMASLMAVNALGIDMMLPALPAIGSDLGVHIENHRQWIIAFYVTGFGIAQLAFGPLADRYGRRKVLFGAMTIYAAMSFAAAHATSFEMLLVARVLQGMAASSTRVLTVSITRDCYSGRRMARVMSLSFLVFLAVPVLAPSLGQMILLVAPWNGIFYALGLFSLVVLVWGAIRLPETLDPAQRRPISVAALLQAASITLRNRYSVGYTIAVSFTFGGLMGFINCAQQIFAEVFHAEKAFPFCFAGIAASMGAAALINSRIVERFGTRKVSHSALLGLIAVSLLHVGVVLSGQETLATFAILQGGTMFFIGLTGSNFGAMAMEDMGAIAGSASSVQGFMATLLGAGVGLVIGQNFHGTTLPLALGFACGGFITLATVLIVERGRLFRPQHEQPTADPNAALHGR